MVPMNEAKVATPFGDKTIAVYGCDIVDFDEPIDVLTVSAFYRSYAPTPRTVINALHNHGISVYQLSRSPQIDLRSVGDIWLSSGIGTGDLKILRVGCIEMRKYVGNVVPEVLSENSIYASLRAYFYMLELAAGAGIPVSTVALPLLGAGYQSIAPETSVIPILNECMAFLKRCAAVKRICIVEKNQSNAFQIAMALQNSYTLQRERPEARQIRPQEEKVAFISYSAKDKAWADALCARLEEQGITAWYAPRDIISSDYASAIVAAITRCRYFIVIVSKNSLQSQHVLNEIDLAFNELKRDIVLMPLRIDEEQMQPAFAYYLSRQHWADAHVPPMEARLEEFVQRILAV